MPILDISVNDEALQTAIDVAVGDTIASVIADALANLPSSDGGSTVVPFGWRSQSNNKLERISKIIVSEDAENDPPRWEDLMFVRLDTLPRIQALGGIKAGDVLQIFAEAHGTNDDARDKDVGVAWVTEFRLRNGVIADPDPKRGVSRTSDNYLFNQAMNHDSASDNVGVEGHHALRARTGHYEFTEDYPAGQPLYFCFMSSVKTTNVPNDSSPDFDITPYRGSFCGTLIRQ